MDRADTAALVLLLEPEDAGRLSRIAGLVPVGRARACSVQWHDTEDGALARDGLAMVSRAGAWALERRRPEHALAAPGVLARARRPEDLGHPVPEGLAPMARLTGTRRAWVADGVRVEVLNGLLDAPGQPPLCRVSLHGDAATALHWADLLARRLSAQVPRASMAEQAMAGAHGMAPVPRATGAVSVQPGQSVGEALAGVIEHLAAVMLHWADQVPAAAGPEPVHQMRVATRRLRSALSVFAPAAGGPVFDALGPMLKDCASRAGAARDWDVFLEGTGAALAAAFPGDRRCAALMRAAARQRDAAYEALRGYLSDGAFRALAVGLAAAAALRPWPEEPAAGPVEAFAVVALDRQWRKVRKAGRDLSDQPVEALHELRKKCKRLRYTAEFMAGLYDGKAVRRFGKRLSALQEELGLINDGASTAGLVAQLGRLERGYAAGLVDGFSAARAGPGRDQVAGHWKRFRKADPFWR